MFLCAVSLAIGLVSCSSGTRQPPSSSALNDDAITVGSFDFAESELLAELYSQSLEAGGFEVRRAFSLGPREFVAPALDQGLVELVPEYAGTALEYHDPSLHLLGASTAATHDALVGALSDTEVRALAPAAAQDANTFVVTRETAKRYDLQALSDVAGIPTKLTFAGPPECPTRPLCLQGLRERYGLTFREVVALDAGGPLTRQALSGGEVDIGLLFTSDPALEEDTFVELADDLALQPADNVTPLVHTEVVNRWGDRLVRRLDVVSEQLTTAALRELNAQLAGGAPVAAVAREWLKARGLS